MYLHAAFTIFKVEKNSERKEKSISSWWERKIDYLYEISIMNVWVSSSSKSSCNIISAWEILYMLIDTWVSWVEVRERKLWKIFHGIEFYRFHHESCGEAFEFSFGGTNCLQFCGTDTKFIFTRDDDDKQEKKGNNHGMVLNLTSCKFFF